MISLTEFEKLIPTGQPKERMLNGRLIYGCRGKLLGYDIKNINSLLTGTQNEMLEKLGERYNAYIKEEKTRLKKLYCRELGGNNPLGWLKKRLRLIDLHYLMLLRQHIYDLEGAEKGLDDESKLPTGRFHAITVEYNILRKYVQLGPGYINPYPVTGMRRDLNRFAEPPDNNLVIFVVGYSASWEAAAREAYATAYKLGYSLEDIYLFNYKLDEPLQLSKVMGSNARYVGDFKVWYELKKTLEMEKLIKKQRWGLFRGKKIEQELEKKLKGLEEKLKGQMFTRDDNLNSTLDGSAARLAHNIEYIKRARIANNAPTKINLIASSQGAGIAGGFLTQNYTSDAAIEAAVNEVLGKTALLISAHGGAYLAQANSIIRQQGNFLFNTGALLLSPIRNIVAKKLTHQLAIDSNFTQRNYSKIFRPNSCDYLPDRELPARLQEKGTTIEIYAANDDVTTSFPLAKLPSTELIRLVSGRHSGIITGSDEQSGNKANKYLYDFFRANKLPVNPVHVESDRLLYSAYLKRGLPDYDLTTAVLDNLFASSPKLIREFFKSFLRVILKNIFGKRLINIALGGAGVIDYEVQKKVMQDLGRKFGLKEPDFWPQLKFEDFYD